jgi:hypothetical protein
LMDHVGRSFSRIRVYTERPSWVPTARRPGRGDETRRVKERIGCTRLCVEGSYGMVFREGEGRMDAPRVLVNAGETPGSDARIHGGDYLRPGG